MIICAKPFPAISMRYNVPIFQRLGYKHVRYDPYTFLFRRKRTGTVMEAFQRDLELIKKAGLTIEEFHYYGSKDFAEFKERIHLYLKLMKIAKTNFLVVHVSEEMMAHTGELNKIIKEFKKNRIHFCVENECRWEEYGAYIKTPELMEEVLEKLPDAEVCLDTGHAFMECIDPYDFYKKFKDKIKVIHLHDFKEGRDHQVPFTGKLLKSPIVEELKQFKGPVVIELLIPLWELIEDKYGRAMEMLSKNLL